MGRYVSSFVKNEFETPGPVERISQFVLNLPLSLFKHLEDGMPAFRHAHQKVALVLEQVQIENGVKEYHHQFGRRSHSRKAMSRAFVAKAVLNIPTTKDLVERLNLDIRLRRICGFCYSVPSESTFSRAFAEFAADGLADQVHASAVRELLGSEIVFHASLDAASIPARERGPRKKVIVKKPTKKRGRQQGQRPGERRKALSPQEIQLKQSWKEALAELPQTCDHGCKIGPKGYMQHWRGFKIHAHVGDGGIPLGLVTTSASIHDSRVAIPLLRMTASRVGTILYNLMDKGYSGTWIETASNELGQVAIVPPKPLTIRGLRPELTPDRKRRYGNRTTVERFFADLKDNHGGNHLFVKGGAKVHAHLMMGVLAIFGLSVLRL